MLRGFLGCKPYCSEFVMNLLFLFFFHLDVGYEYLTRSALKQSLITVLTEDQYLVDDPLGLTLTLICDKYLPCFVSLPWRCVLHGLRSFRLRVVSFRLRVRSFRLICGWKNKVIYTRISHIFVSRLREEGNKHAQRSFHFLSGKT